MDKANFLEQFISLLENKQVRYCIIGGQAVNAYVEPLVSLDLDVVIAVDQLDEISRLMSQHFVVKPFPHSINLEMPNSDLRIQIQTDERYSNFVSRATHHAVLGLSMSVASLEDILQGKIWAAQDPLRRGSKRQKDYADIARIIEAYPNLREQVPVEILQRID